MLIFINVTNKHPTKKLVTPTSNPSWSCLDKLKAIKANAPVEVRFIVFPYPFFTFPSSQCSSKMDHREVSIKTTKPTCAFNNKLFPCLHLHLGTKSIKIDKTELTTLYTMIFSGFQCPNKSWKEGLKP